MADHKIFSSTPKVLRQCLKHSEAADGSFFERFAACMEQLKNVDCMENKDDLMTVDEGMHRMRTSLD